VWTVISNPVASPDGIELMPVLQLDYTVDTNLAGDARGGRQRLQLAASHLVGAVGAGRVTRMKLEVSYDDGASWRPVDLSGAGAQRAALFDAPRRGFVSLRASAWDDAGNAVTQEVIRAYGLVPAVPTGGHQER